MCIHNCFGGKPLMLPKGGVERIYYTANKKVNRIEQSSKISYNISLIMSMCCLHQSCTIFLILNGPLFIDYNQQIKAFCSSQTKSLQSFNNRLNEKKSFSGLFFEPSVCVLIQFKVHYKEKKIKIHWY